jgi:uncharacterized protein (DUF2147 family)
MKRLALLGVILTLVTGPAFAGDPAGEWLVEDGSARIRIAICNGVLWGVIGWEKSPGKDTENPDPAKRSRPTLGIPILISMKPAGTDKWAGQIYNAQNGKMYQADVTLESEKALKVRGCIMGGLFCGGETWSRFAVPPAPAAAVCSRLGPEGATSGSAGTGGNGGNGGRSPGPGAGGNRSGISGTSH